MLRGDAIVSLALVKEACVAEDNDLLGVTERLEARSGDSFIERLLRFSRSVQPHESSTLCRDKRESLRNGAGVRDRLVAEADRVLVQPRAVQTSDDFAIG